MRKKREWRMMKAHEIVEISLNDLLVTDYNSDLDKEILKELVACRVIELLPKNSGNEIFAYIADQNAFTCQIEDKAIIVKHDTLEDAIKYAIEYLGVIAVIFKQKVVPCEQFSLTVTA